MSSRNLWTKKELSILRKIYPAEGSKGVQKLLPFRSRESILSHAKKFRIRVKASFRQSKVDVSRLVKANSPESAYVLGILWEDGNVSIRGTKYRTSINLTDTDFEDIGYMFPDWIFSVLHHPDKTWKIAYSARLNHKTLALFLNKYDYTIKSHQSPTKILKVIPERLHKYFFRGWFDADGSNNQVDRRKASSIAGSFNQKWTALETLCCKLNIRYNIIRSRRSYGSASSFYFVGLQANLKFFDYIYSGKSLGFSRKRLNFKLLKKQFSKELKRRLQKPKGVYPCGKRWVVEVWKDGVKHSLGMVDSLKEGSHLYDKHCLKLHKDITMLNNPPNSLLSIVTKP